MSTIPQSLSNLVLWLDGNDPAGTGTPPANNASITTWVDKSSSAASGTPTGTPVYQTSFANGYGSVKFPGSAYIQNTSYSLTLSSKSFFMVCSSYAAATNANPAGFMSFGNTAQVYNQQNGTAYQGPESSFNNKFGFLQAYGNGGYYTSFGSPFGETPLAIYSDTQNGTAAALYVNGSNLANHTLSYTPGTSTQYRIGRRTDALGQYLYGNVCEVLVYTGVLSTTNRQLIEGYLAWKWGLQASLPSGHPYLSAAPFIAPSIPLTIPSNTSLLLVNTSSFSKTFRLPAISTNPGRLLIFKDIYGSFSTNSVFLSTTGIDGFENNSSTMRLNTNYGAWTFMNDAMTRWYLIDSYKNTMLLSTITQAAVSEGGRFPLVQTSALIVKLDGASYSAGGGTWTDSVASANWTMTGTTYDSATQAVVFSSSLAYVASVANFNSNIHTVVMYYFRTGNSPNASGYGSGSWVNGGMLYQISRSGSNTANQIAIYEPSMWEYSNTITLSFNANTSLTGTTGWVMRAFVKNGATGTYYLNGVADGTQTVGSTTSIRNGDFCIGRDYRDNIAFLQGKVALFAMWNVALSASDISTIHNNCKAQFGL